MTAAEVLLCLVFIACALGWVYILLSWLGDIYWAWVSRQNRRLAQREVEEERRR